MSTQTPPSSSPPVPVVDHYALDAAAIETPPQRLSLAFRQIGPGLILAGSIVGTGELIATTHLGAKVGFALLWLIIVSCFIKVFIQAELGRYAISSGQTTLAAFRQLPVAGQIIGWCWLFMMLTTQLQLAAVVGGVGQAFHMAIPGASPLLASLFPTDASAYLNAHPELPWAILTAIGTSLLLAIGGYGIIEKSSTAMVVTFTIATVLCVAMLPAAGHPIPWSSVAAGLKCSFPETPGALATAFAVLGLTGVGAAELVAYPYWCIEKGYARKAGPRDDSPEWLARARGWLRVMKLDAWSSMALYTIATLAFYFLGATVLHGRNPAGLPRSVSAMLTTLSEMYRPVLGARLAVWFIVIGVFAVLYSTLYSATGANSRALADFFHTHCGRRFTTPNSRTQTVRILCILFPILDLSLYLAVRDPVTMVLIGGFAQASTLPLIAAAALYLRYRRTDQRLAPGRVWDLFLWVSLLGLCLAAGYGIYDAYQKLPR